MNSLVNALPWLLAALIAVLWALLRFHRQRHDQALAFRREADIHKENLVAIENGLEPSRSPEDPPGIVEAIARSRFERRVLLLGVILLTGGLGYGLGLKLVPRTPETLGMQELASLGLAPVGVGAGLLLYLALAKKFLP